MSALVRPSQLAFRVYTSSRLLTSLLTSWVLTLSVNFYVSQSLCPYVCLSVSLSVCLSECLWCCSCIICSLCHVYIQEQMCEYPLIRCLVVVLKQFLIYHNLLESFNGGISSYCLILLILSYLQVSDWHLIVHCDVKLDFLYSMFILLKSINIQCSILISYEKIAKYR